MIKDKQFALDVLLTSFGQIIVVLIIFVQNKWLSIALESQGYLEYYLINQTGCVISFFTLFGLGIAIPRYIARTRAVNDFSMEASYFFSAIIILIVTICIGGALLICMRNYLNNFVFEGRNETLLTFVLSVGICLSNFIYSYYRGAGNFIFSNAAQIIIGITCVCYLLFVNNVELAVIGISVIQIFFSGALIACLLVKYIRAKCSELSIKDRLLELLSYCLPRVPGEIFLFSYNIIPVALINNLYGSEVGIKYVIALGIVAAASPLFKFVGMVLLPYASKIITNGEKENLFKNVNWLLKASLIFTIISVAIINIAPKFIILVLYSPMYYSASDVVRIVSFCIIPHSVYLILRNPLDGLSKKPYNTIGIFISLIALCFMLFVSKYFKNTEIIVPLCFVVGNVLLGVVCYVFWKIEIRKTSLNIKYN